MLEREEALAVLARLRDEAVAGSGRMVFVAGEAGIGKTTLVTVATAITADGTPRLRRGTCDSVITADALGPIVEAFPELSDLVEREDFGRHALLQAFREAVCGEPTILLLEDLHWADEPTLTTLRHLGRRLDDLPLLVISTFRSDEVSRRHPLALTLGDLATAPAVWRVDLQPLSVAAVRCLVEQAGSAVDADRLHANTGGNPFFVTEVLATGTDDVPPTVRDAVLARAGRLSTAAQHVLAAAAVLGQRADVRTLTSMTGRSPSAVDECVGAGVLVVDADGLVFRHELARRVVEQDLTPGERVALHTAALRVLRLVAGIEDRRLAHHAAGCGDDRALLVHAPAAAARAARLGAHCEAAKLYRSALRAHAATTAQRRDLLERLAYECYLTEDLPEAITAQQQLMELAELDDDPRAVGVALRWLSRLSWFSGRTAEAVRHAARAVATLEALDAGPELAMAYSNMAQLRMLAGDVRSAVAWGNRAVHLARALGDREIEAHALNNVGTAMMTRGDAVEGRQKLLHSLDVAQADDLHEHVARAYTNLGTTAALLRQHDDAERQLRAGIRYSRERDLDTWLRYMSAWLARSLAERGRLDEAADHAAEVLRHPHLTAVTEIAASVAAAQVSIRRGHDAAALLDQALRLAVVTGEPQRLVPVAAARAEAAWLAGRPDRIADEVDRAWPAAVEHPNPWELGELCWWLAVAGAPRHQGVAVAEPFGLMLAGAWGQAAEVWQDLGCALWTATALARSPGLDEARQAVQILDDLSAPAVREALLRDRHAAGLPVPRGPRPSNRGNPSLLTARELDILRLLVDGLSNAQIARTLYLSEKTVGHHVSAVLRKLGEPTRARAAATALRRGLVVPANAPT